MYNRYFNHDEYVQIEPEHTPPPEPVTKKDAQPASALLGEVSGGITQLLGGLFKNLKTENFDAGDILLVLIILLLLLEGDNLEIVITLGLMLLLGLGDD